MEHSPFPCNSEKRGELRGGQEGMIGVQRREEAKPDKGRGQARREERRAEGIIGVERREEARAGRLLGINPGVWADNAAEPGRAQPSGQLSGTAGHFSRGAVISTSE